MSLDVDRDNPEVPGLQGFNLNDREEGEIDGALFGPDNYRVGARVTDDTPLTRVLGGASGAVYNDHTQYLKYNGGLSTTAKVQGRNDSSTKNIQYNIQARAPDGNIDRAPPGVVQLPDCVPVSSQFQSDVAYASSRNAAFPRAFHTIGLLGVVERMAAGVGKFAMYGTLTPAQLRGGGNLVVRAINAATDNIAVGPANVFVTKTQSSWVTPGVDTALFSAINGEGAIPYTDLLEIDAAGIPQVPAAQNALLAQGCMEAINCIGRLYIACDQGPAFALAVTRGFYKTITLAGHTDEGGYVRSVLRRGSYAPPHGAVFIALDQADYTGLPSPGGGISNYRKLAHSIVLGAGAGVACSDPTVEYNGIRYPTSITLTSGPDDDPGVPPAGPYDIRNRPVMQSRWAEACAGWAPNFSYYLGRLFAAPGDTHSAVLVLNTAARSCVGCNDTHLDHVTVMPFAYVEPTSITPFWDSNLPAMEADCGALTVDGVTRKVPVFRNYTSDGITNGPYHSGCLKLGFFRRHGALVHCIGHPQDGMAHIKLFSGSSHTLFNVGGAGPIDNRILGGNGLDTYEWGKLHCQLPMIGEFMDASKETRLLFETFTVPDIDAPWNQLPSHCFDAGDMNGFVTYRTIRPKAQEQPAALVADNRKWSRARSSAAKGLTLVAIRRNTMGWGADIRPVLGDPRGSVVPINDPLSGYFDGSGTIINMDDTLPTEGSTESSRPPHNMAQAPGGAAVPLVIHNVAAKGRQPVRPRGGGGGSGGGGAARGAGGGGRGRPPGP